MVEAARGAGAVIEPAYSLFLEKTAAMTGMEKEGPHL
jgi:hypothetical protein